MLRFLRSVRASSVLNLLRWSRLLLPELSASDRLDTQPDRPPIRYSPQTRHHTSRQCVRLSYETLLQTFQTPFECDVSHSFHSPFRITLNMFQAPFTDLSNTIRMWCCKLLSQTFQTDFDYLSSSFCRPFKRLSFRRPFRHTLTIFHTPFTDLSNSFRICFTRLSQTFQKIRYYCNRTEYNIDVTI
jgi:hypothetical protein